VGVVGALTVLLSVQVLMLPLAQGWAAPPAAVGARWPAWRLVPRRPGSTVPRGWPAEPT
jgi:hypothetical protein